MTISKKLINKMKEYYGTEYIKVDPKSNDPFGFKKAIDTSVIDKLTPKELDEAMVAAGLGLSRDDFSDDGADLQDLKEIYEGNGS